MYAMNTKSEPNRNTRPRIWWRPTTPIAKDDDDRDQPTFYEELVDFLENISMHCYRWMLEPTISVWENIMWWVVHVVGVVTIVFMLSTIYSEYISSPMVTTLYDTLYPISSVPFPAIAICSNNRISRTAALQFAEELQIISANKTDREWLLQNVRKLGYLYDSDMDDEAEMIKFQNFLDEHDLDERKVLESQMHALSPKCEDILIRCIWRGEERPCMDKQMMFDSRNAQYGPCCTFNYVRPDSLDEEEPESFFLDDTGPELGLILLLNGTSNDYFYPFFNFLGFIVQVFNPHEFPDVPSGSVSERVIKLGYETLVRIDSTTLLAESQTRRYGPQDRGCLFSDELAAKFGGRYKRSDCVIICRVASILALCNCLVFYMPNPDGSGADADSGVPMCSLEHVPCLNRYRVKWSTMVIEQTQEIGLQVEMEDGLFCEECLPSCSDTTYAVTSHNLPLIPTHRPYQNIIIGDMLNDIFSLHYVVQFSFSGFIICVTCFQLSVGHPMEHLSQFLFHCEYFVCMAFEIFLPCYYGSRVSAQSFRLYGQMYNSNWVEQSVRFKSAMNIFVLRAQRPIALFTYKKWFAIELPTFVSILRFAYSMLSCLKAQ